MNDNNHMDSMDMKSCLHIAYKIASNNFPRKTLQEMIITHLLLYIYIFISKINSRYSLKKHHNHAKHLKLYKIQIY